MIQHIHFPGLKTGLFILLLLCSGLPEIALAMGDPLVFENANWKVFTNRRNVQAFLLSDNGKTLWVATTGGLEQRNAINGQLDRIFTQLDGLPHNEVNALESDGQGRLWIGTDNGLAYRSINGEWSKIEGLPSQNVTALENDENDGLWIGTAGGLAYLNVNDELQIDILPNRPRVNALLRDESGGLWIGTSTGLVYRNSNDQFNTQPNSDKVNTLLLDENNGLWIGIGSIGSNGSLAYQARVNEAWTVRSNFGGPNTSIEALVSDNNGGLWIGTSDAGIVHRNASGEIDTVKMENSQLPDDKINALLRDNTGGLWIGTFKGIAYRTNQGELRSYEHEYDLPHNKVTALESDNSSGIWVDTIDGRAHRSVSGDWSIDDSNFPGNLGNILEIADSYGGQWIGSQFDGITYLREGKSILYHSANSGLPFDWISALLMDDNEGLWIGTNGGGLAHLTFGQKSILCHQNLEACEPLETQQRAAIIIHPNPDFRGNRKDQAEAVNFMATHVYQNMVHRGYDNEEIYFLSYQPDLDFNRDRQADVGIVDAPVTLTDVRSKSATPRNITVDDIQAAFDWAIAKGKLDQPLIVVALGHGIPGELLLNPQQNLSAKEDIKYFLDTYQEVTGNAVVIMIEACHSGTLIPTLQAPARLIITSTDNNEAYYDDNGHESFIKFYFDELRQGVNFKTALEHTQQVIGTYPSPRNQQKPQWFQGGEITEKLCLNGCYGSLVGEVTLTVEELAPIVPLGQPLDLNAFVIPNGVGIKQISASIMTPLHAHQRHDLGFPWLPPPPSIMLFLTGGHTLRKDLSEEHWTGKGFGESLTMAGQYVITIEAEDSKGNFTHERQTMTVEEGPEMILPTFDGETLHLPAIMVTDPKASSEPELYQAKLVLKTTETEPDIILEVSEGPLPADEESRARASYAYFTPPDQLYIPSVKIPNTDGGYDIINGTLKLLDASQVPMQFRVVELPK